jgi:uncharacterized membrane protein
LIEHLLSHPMGFIHVCFALLALIFGGIVLLKRKGNSTHRWIGRIYLVSMLALNITALLDYELFGRFGPFHWMALFSLATVIGGYWAVVRKNTNWKYRHAYFMVGSYVGLVAAAVAETATRIPGWSFAPTVIISSVLVILVGVSLMMKLLPRIL